MTRVTTNVTATLQRADAIAATRDREHVRAPRPAPARRSRRRSPTTRQPDRDAGPDRSAARLDDLHRHWSRAGTDPRVKDLAGNALASERQSGRSPPRRAAAARVSRASIWTPARRPSRGRDDRSDAVELGTKFRSDVAGYITGARFYKGAANTGTHVGEAVDQHGTLLGTRDVHRRDGVRLAGGDVPDAGRDRREHDLRHLVSRHNGHYSRPRPATSPPRASTTAAARAARTASTAPTASTATAPSAFPTDTFQSRGLLGRRRLQHHRSAPTPRRRR